MSEEAATAPAPTPTPDAAEAAPPSVPPPSRPRIALGNGTRGGRGGKSMFGLVLGTLNKAKIESKEREASDAAKRRQLLEARLQAKLRNETAEVRRQEEAKKDKTLAVRKEEELGVRVSVYRLRRTRTPYLANFLCTSDVILDEQTMEEDVEQSDAQSFAKILEKAKPPRSHPPPLYYLPKKLLPSQEAFFKKRKEEITVASAAEWSAFAAERDASVQEIRQLREKVSNAQAIEREEKRERNRNAEGDGVDATGMDVDGSNKDGDKDAKQSTESTSAPTAADVTSEEKDKTAAMDVDKPSSTQPENDNDDAVEY